jgi:VWFA-related protein
MTARLRLSIPAIVVLTAAAAIALRAQSPQPPVFRSSADLVTIDVTVTTSGTPVAGLRAADFVLTDNGVPQTLEVVALEAVPATVTMIIDIGDFMSDTIRSFVDDIRNIVAMVRPDDNVRLMAIDTYVRDLVPLRKSADWPVIDRIATNGLASATDAIAAAIMRQHAPTRQHLIVAMTNGVDTGSVLDIHALTEIARRSNAPLHIVPADLELLDVGPPKRYNTRQERGRGLGFSRRRFWKPFHDRDFELQEAAARLTGGDWIMPSIFTNRGASDIFGKFYNTHRRSYRLTYTPKGVARQGWHAVSVTVPQYPSYTVASRPGYAFETRPSASMPLADDRSSATLEGLVAAYDRADYASFMDGVRQTKDFSPLIEAFSEGVNPWPDRPRRESAFVLELVHAALATGQRSFVPAVQKLLDRHRVLVRDPLGPEPFERYWLWTAVAILQSVNEAAVTESFLNHALARFPDEPRLKLAKAFLLDRRQPFAAGDASQTTIVIPQVSGAAMIPGRMSLSTGLAASHVREVSAAYERAMGPEDTKTEARVRQSLLLYRAGRHHEALALLDSADARSSDAALRYFRELFRGRILTALGSTSEAEEAYRAALSVAPLAQSPNIALMSLALMRGDRERAASLAEQVQTAASGWDPWWNYWQGDYRMVPGALARLRSQTQ